MVPKVICTLGSATVSAPGWFDLYRPYPYFQDSQFKLWLETRLRGGPFRLHPGSESSLMAWYAYCLTEHQTLPNGTRTRRPFLLEGVQGVNGAAVLSYPSGEFAVIVSEYDHTAGELDHKAHIDHARVVSNCFRNSTVLALQIWHDFRQR